MREFALAALPWVLAGIAIAIICAGLGRRENDERGKKLDQRIALGMSLGMLFGVALNGRGLWGNPALGLAIWPLWGMALAVLYGGGEPPEDGEGGED